jgi:hypothetical protein
VVALNSSLMLYRSDRWVLRGNGTNQHIAPQPEKRSCVSEVQQDEASMMYREGDMISCFHMCSCH